MSELEFLLLGYALGAIPNVRLARVALAFITKKLGVKPSRIEATQEATQND